MSSDSGDEINGNERFGDEMNGDETNGEEMNDGETNDGETNGDEMNGDEMNGDERVGLQQRFDGARQTYDSYVNRVRSAAGGARSEVVSKLEHAMQSLIGVVTKVHATYTEDEQFDDSRKEILRNMKASFESVESTAESRHQEIANVHEEVASFQSGTIIPLQNDLKNTTDEATRKRDEAQRTADQASGDYDAAVQRRKEAQADVDKWQDIVDNPVIDAGATIFSWTPVGLLAGAITKAVVDEGEPTNAKEALDACRNRLNEQRVTIETSEREMREAKADVLKNNTIKEDSARLIQEVTPLSVAAQDLANNSDKFKELLIRVKGSATNLVKEATEVDASIQVTSDNSFTKSDFAQGILNICQEALFDVLVQDEVEIVLQELATAWTTNGQLSMPPRLKKRYDEVRNIVQDFKQDGKTAEWDALLQELNASEANTQGNDRNHEGEDEEENQNSHNNNDDNNNDDNNNDDNNNDDNNNDDNNNDDNNNDDNNNDGHDNDDNNNDGNNNDDNEDNDNEDDDQERHNNDGDDDADHDDGEN